MFLVEDWRLLCYAVAETASAAVLMIVTLMKNSFQSRASVVLEAMFAVLVDLEAVFAVMVDQAFAVA